MKKINLHLLLLLSIVGFTSCTQTPTSFDKTLLYGKWQDGTYYEKYNSDLTGHYWDTSDDVTEAEAKHFSWTLTDDQLVRIDSMENGQAVVPETFTITKLTSTTLAYKDDYGSTYTFTRIN